MRTVIKAADKYVNRFLTFVAIIMLAAMSVIVFAQVVFRIMHASIPWSEEASKYLLIWCTFLGSAMGVRKGSLVGLEFIGNMLPKKVGNILKLAVDIVIVLLLMLLIVVGFWASGRVWFQTTPVLKLPMGLMYAAIPVGSVFMLFNLLVTTFYRITGEEEA